MVMQINVFVEDKKVINIPRRVSPLMEQELTIIFSHAHEFQNQRTSRDFFHAQEQDNALAVEVLVRHSTIWRSLNSVGMLSLSVFTCEC